jgi:ZIP family zinc transporter
MTFVQTVSLGAVAGFTIYLALPIGRFEVSPRVRSFLTASSAGVLIFILFDILSHIKEPIETALRQTVDEKAHATDGILLLIIFVIGLGGGLLGLLAFESRFLRARTVQAQPLSPPRLAFLIATGIGLHNFSEGLAIGQSAVQGEIAFATLLIIGFALHNATEGFGIVGPLAGTRPSWGFLGLLGLVGGAPTFLGTVIGFRFTSEPISILFLALAAGAILYVIGELYDVSRRAGLKTAATCGLLIGFLVAYGTELILEMSGA